MNKLFIAFVAFIATFFVHGFQFFKKQTPLVNALVVGLVVYFVAGFLGFKEGMACDHAWRMVIHCYHCPARRAVRRLHRVAAR